MLPRNMQGDLFFLLKEAFPAADLLEISSAGDVLRSRTPLGIAVPEQSRRQDGVSAFETDHTLYYAAGISRGGYRYLVVMEGGASISADSFYAAVVTLAGTVGALERGAPRQLTKQDLLLRNLLSDFSNPSGSFITSYIAESMNIDLSVPRIVGVADLSHEVPDIRKRRTLLHAALDAIYASRLWSAQDVIGTDEKLRIVLGHPAGADDGEIRSRCRDFFSDIRDTILSAAGRRPLIGVGLPGETALEFRWSYTSACRALAYAAERPDGIAFAGDHFADFLLENSPLPLIRHYFHDRAMRCLENDKRMSTMRHMVDCDFNIEKAARAAYVHRNTMVTYFNHLRDALQLDPVQNDFDGYYLQLLKKYCAWDHDEDRHNGRP